MTTFTLPRTGFPDVAFDGVLLAEQHAPLEISRTGNRRHDIAVYQSTDGEVIVAIHSHSEEINELSDDFVEVVNSVDDVEEVLSLYEPHIHFVNEEPGRRADGFDTIAREVTRQYDLLVDTILRELASANTTDSQGQSTIQGKHQ